MKKLFNNKYNRIDHSVPEIFPEISRVSMVGYIPRHRQISILIEAGKKLDRLRGQFDLKPGEKFDLDDIECDPTRSKSFDLAEASSILSRYKIVNVNLETLEYIDAKGIVRKFPSGVPVESLQKQNKGLDTASRSVSSPLTPENEMDKGKDKVKDVIEQKKNNE